MPRRGSPHRSARFAPTWPVERTPTSAPRSSPLFETAADSNRGEPARHADERGRRRPVSNDQRGRPVRAAQPPANPAAPTTSARATRQGRAGSGQPGPSTASPGASPEKSERRRSRRERPVRAAQAAANPVRAQRVRAPARKRVSADAVGESDPSGSLRQRRSRCPHSHSIVPGGFEVMSYTTRLTPGTSLMIRCDITSSVSYGTRAQSAVIASSLVTARITIGWP